MSQYQAIKAATNAYIKTNGRQEITGAILNAVMIATIDSLGKFYQFYGNATPETDPGAIDQNIAFLASTPGTYTHLGGFTINPGEFAVIKFDGEWKKEVVITIPSKVSQLENDLGFITNAVSDLVNYYTKGETFTKDEVTSILGNYYDKDEVDSIVSALTRQSYVVAWDGTAEPVVGDIPAGVSVTWGGNPYVGTLPASASTIGRIYLVSNGAGYDEYITTEDGGYSWISIGTTSIDLSGYVTQDQFTQLEHKVDDLTEELGEINPHITGRIGVTASNDDVIPSSLPEYEDQYGIITITLGTSGYLWLCLENDHFRITSGGVEIPMVYVKESGDLHCYVSAEKINAGTMQFRVESIHPIKSQGERVTITARDYIVTYGDAMPDFGYIADGEIVGTPAITCEAVQGSPAGTYEIVIARGSVEDDNCIYVNGTLTIQKAELIVTADNKQVAVGGAMPAFTMQYSGFVLGEDASDLTTAPTCTTNAEDTNTEGNYNIVPSGGVSDNYSFTYVDGVLTIGEPVILTLTRAGMYDSGSCGGFIDANDGDKYKNSTTYYGILVDIRKYKGHKMKITKTVSNFRIAVLKAATLTNNTKPTFSTATGFTGLINYSWGTGETEKEYTLPSDAAYLYVYVYNSSYDGTSFAPKIEILGVPPTAEYKNLTASLFSTNTTIGNDGTVFTGASAPDTICTDYLDASVYTRLLVASFIKNTLPEGVAKLSTNVAYYDGNKKFIKRDSFHAVPMDYNMPPSTAYIRVMVNQVDSNNTNLSGDTIRFDGNALQIEGVATS